MKDGGSKERPFARWKHCEKVGRAETGAWEVMAMCGFDQQKSQEAVQQSLMTCYPIG